jgi:hypothetical protein
MIDKEFIPYQEALELKQLEFNEPCFAWYDSAYQDIPCYYHANNSDGWLFGNNCSAPTYSQAFRWFREKHDFESYIRANLFFDGTKTYQFYIDDNIDDVWYDNYEEAELACLKELIEIVQGGKKL